MTDQPQEQTPVLYDTPVYDPALREHVLARHVPYEDFLRLFDGRRTEWLNGTVILDMTNNVQHQRILFFLSRLCIELLNGLGGGDVLLAGVSLRTRDDLPAREPDLMILLPGNPIVIEATHVRGIPDIVVEIVSPESVVRDRGDKFYEYEQAGIPEYWLIDPVRGEASVCRLGEDGHYRLLPREGGVLVSSVLARLRLPVPLLWETRTITTGEIRALVEGMLS